MKKILIYISGLLTIIWGISHLFPTMNIVKGFGEISADNRHIITMEWITEGLTLIFLGVLTIAVTLIDINSKVTRYVLIMIILMLLAMTVVSLFTGFKIHFLPFRLCPVIFSLSALLILTGINLKTN